jgi:hypothetical protein
MTERPEDVAWRAAGLPLDDPPYVHAHQRWAPERRHAERTQPAPWDLPATRAAVPCAQWGRTERALDWLWREFGRGHPHPLLSEEKRDG